MSGSRSLIGTRQAWFTEKEQDNLYHWRKDSANSRDVIANRWVITDEVTCSLPINYGSAYQITQDKFGSHKTCARWLPTELSAENKHKRDDVCQRLFESELFFSRSHRRWNVGSSLWTRIQKPDYGVETFWLANDEEIQDSIFGEKGDANRFWGTQKGLYWKTTWGVRSTVQDTVLCLSTIWSLQFVPNAETYCRRMFSCCTTMDAHIQLVRSAVSGA